MELLFHGLIWELEHSELGIELWLWLEDWFTEASMASGRAWTHLSSPCPDLPLAASSPGLAEPPEWIFLLAPSKVLHWLPNICDWFGHLSLRPLCRGALLGRVFLHPCHDSQLNRCSSCRIPTPRTLPNTKRKQTRVLIWDWMLCLFSCCCGTGATYRSCCLQPSMAFRDRKTRSESWIGHYWAR